jgi:HD superfamily phosphohydrolase
MVPEPIGPQDEVLLRLVALLHDVGHGFLSHVSERAMEHLQELPGGGTIREFREAARSHFRCRPGALPLAEILSALLVLLPEFIEVLALARVPGWEADQLADHIAHLIVGGVKAPTRPFMNEIISGPMDADKLDYMPRDCYMAGLPMPVDVERLLEKVQVVSLSANILPDAYAEYHELPPDRTVQVLTVEPSGGRTVPRWTPQNRPYVDRAKPAIGRAPKPRGL